MKKYTSGIELNGSLVSETVGKELRPFDYARIEKGIIQVRHLRDTLRLLVCPYFWAVTLAVFTFVCVLRGTGLSKAQVSFVTLLPMLWLVWALPAAQDEHRLARMFRNRATKPNMQVIE